MKKLNHLLLKKSSGFTLIELLVAITMTSILVAGSSIGLTTILQKNAENERRIVRRQEASRALSFITEEIKMAQTISNDPENDAPSGSELPSGTSDKDTVLVLTIPDFDAPVVYRVAKPASDSLWEGPRVIYRWGPDFKADGTYDTSSWENNPLIDLVTASDEDNFSYYCNQSYTDKIPADSPQGFYICLEGNKVAEIVIRSSEGEIKTSRKAFARSAN